MDDPFIARALIELTLVGVLCGVIGVHVVLRRQAFLTESLAHSTFPGAVTAQLAGLNPWVGATGSALAMACWVSTDRGRSTTLTATALAASFGLGSVLISTQPGFTRALSAVLTGSPLTVTGTDLILTAVIGLCVLIVLAGLHKELVLAAFDPTAFQALGYPVRRMNLLLNALLALTLVTCTPAVGVILPVALVAGPAAVALRWTRRIIPAMALAALLGPACGALGLALSTRYDLATGATVCLVAGSLFLLAHLIPGSAPAS